MAHRGAGGIRKRRGNDDVTIPQFAIPPEYIEGIAKVILDAWDNKLPGFDERETRSGATRGMATEAAVKIATKAINDASPGFGIGRAVIITEEEHDNGYTMQTEDDVVFVLPKETRIDPAGANLLSSAKLLMACTPNGI